MSKPSPDQLQALRDEIYDAARSLFDDAASWRDTATMTGGYAATALMRDALENERLSALMQGWVDKLEDAMASLAPAPVTPPVQDEEVVPHAFVSRTPYEPGDDRDIWCKDCEYHRDHQIHWQEAPAPVTVPADLKALTAALVEGIECWIYDSPPCPQGANCDHCQRYQQWARDAKRLVNWDDGIGGIALASSGAAPPHRRIVQAVATGEQKEVDVGPFGYPVREAGAAPPASPITAEQSAEQRRRGHE